MSLGQHEKSATCKKCNTTKLQYETTIMQLDQSATQKECNMKKAQREKSAT